MKFEGLQVISWDLYDDSASSYEKNTGHSILIPNRNLDEFMYTVTDGNPLYLEITSNNNTPERATAFGNNYFRCLVFSNVGVSNNDTLCVLPAWAMEKLNLQQFDQINIESVNNLRKITYIRVKGSNSSYIYWDNIRGTLEQELSSYRCIAVGDIIFVRGVEFYVTELRDENNIGCADGSIFDTEAKVDFDTPTDIEHNERIKAEEEEMLRTKEEEASVEEDDDEPWERPSREQIAMMYERLFNGEQPQTTLS